MYSIPTPAKYNFWIKNNINVLFIGKHGVGKTESVKEKFNEHFGDRWLYFSASTMDPWVDFVRVPKEMIDPDTGNSYLGLVRPKMLANDEVEAIVIDEYNRSSPKVKNSVMELIQFKSINGKKFNNLKIIWAMVNPDDDETYDVERLDPAQKDRFQVHVYYPYEVNREYFIKKYGFEGETACMWWDKQDEEIKNQISPRRLAYAMDMYNLQGDLSDVLPHETNFEELLTQLTNGSFLEKLKVLFALKDDKKTAEALASENFVYATEKYIMENNDYLAYFVPMYPKDRLVNLFLNNEKVRRYFDEHEDYRNFQQIFDPVINGNSVTQQSIKSLLKRWKGRTVSIDAISDIEFIDMVVDNRRNIELLSNTEKQRDVINKFGMILNNKIIIDQGYYIKMLGVSCELLIRVNDNLKEYVIKNIKSIKQIFINQQWGQMEGYITQDLPGLRRAKTGTLFDEIVEILKKEHIVEDVNYI